MDKDDREIYRRDIDDKRVLNKQVSKLEIDTELEDKPYSYMIWPYSREYGYMQKHFYGI